MKAFLTFIAILAVAAIALAQNPATPNPDDRITRPELRNLDNYLDRNPQVASDLKANPSLINNPTYLQSHPGLQQFLRNHPGVAEEAAGNPNRLMNRERVYDNRGLDITRRQDASFDRYLDTHPAVEQQLRRNPNLVNDPNYLAQHPGLQQYMNTHPGMAKELKENPRAVMRSERRYEKTAQDRRQDRRLRRHMALRNH